MRSSNSAVAAVFSLVAYTASLLLLCSCSRHEPSTQRAGEPEVEPATALIVSVAASTQEPVVAIVKSFEKESNTPVKLNAGASSTLATQIINGAPVDVFLSASREWSAELQKNDLAAEVVPLLSNSLVLIVPQGNPAKVTSPADIMLPAVSHVALAGEKVPAGEYATQALKSLNLFEKLEQSAKIVRGQDVRATLNYVARGEAEAGIVYATDAKITTEVEVVHVFDAALHTRIEYMLVLTTQVRDKRAARQLFDTFQSSVAETAFRDAGFTWLGKP